MWSFYAPRQVQRSRRMDSFACSFLEKRKFLRFENIFEEGEGVEWNGKWKVEVAQVMRRRLFSLRTGD